MGNKDKHWQFKKGIIPWNKGKKGVYSEETLDLMKNFRKNIIRDKHPRWNGGIRMANGYITILMPEHPYCGKKGYVREHRLIMESHIGRILLPTEVVHHINSNKLDNRIENLMLFNSNSDHQSFHAKQRKNKCKK